MYTVLLVTVVLIVGLVMAVAAAVFFWRRVRQDLPMEEMNHSIRWCNSSVLAATMLVMPAAMGVMFTVVDLSSTAVPVTLTVSTSETGFSNGGFIAVVRFAEVRGRRYVLTYHDGDVVPDLLPGSQVKATRRNYGSSIEYSFP